MFKSSAKYLRKNIINYVFIYCLTHPPNFWMWMFFQWSLNCEQKGIREQAIVSSFGIQKQAMSPFTKPRQKKKNSFSLTAFIIYSPLYFLPPLFSSFVKKSILLFFVIWAPLLYEPFFCQSVSQLHLCVSVWTMSLITLFFFWRHGLSKQCKKYKSKICPTPCPQSPLNFPI